MSYELEFEKAENGYTLMKCISDDEIIIIPETYKGESVTSTSFSAFFWCENLTEITIPKTIDFLDRSAFCRNPKLVKINLLNENLKKDTVLEVESEYFEELNLFAWKFLYQPTLIKFIKRKIKKFDTLPPDEQKQVLSFIKRRPTLKEALFTSADITIVNFMFANKININLDNLNRYLEQSIEKEDTVITAIFLENKNKNFSKQELDLHTENKELVEIGLELPTLKQFKLKWNVGKVEGGIRITGYIGNEKDETIPKVLACGTKIVSLGYVKYKDFKPIENLTIEAEITFIDKKIFEHHSNLTTIKLPNTLRIIKHRAFSGCYQITDLEIPEGVTEIDSYAFSFSGLQRIVLPNSVETLDRLTFWRCEHLKEVILSNSIKIIPGCCFENCDNLAEIILPSSVEFVDEFAFKNCTNLKLVKYSGKVNFHNDAFSGCPNVQLVQE